MKKSADISKCNRYRYSLVRDWSDGAPIKTVAFVGLNPSTADATLDDPTIRRCIGFAKAWGYNRLVMLNLFAFRATDPADMKAASDPMGFHNFTYIVATNADLTVAAWGTHGSYLGMGTRILRFLKNPHHLGLTKDGHPKHPLYLRADTKPQPFIQELISADVNG